MATAIKHKSGPERQKFFSEVLFILFTAVSSSPKRLITSVSNKIAGLFDQVPLGARICSLDWGMAMLRIMQINTQPALKKIKLTENQFKVIKDKYLRDAPSVESWLNGVCENIALAELLYIPELREEIFKDVRVHPKTVDVGDGKTCEMILLHAGMHNHEEQNKNFKVFMSNLYRLAKENPKGREAVSRTRERFYELLSTFQFLPNSPTLMNAGRSLQQLSACYVLPVGDSIEEIYDAVKSMALIHKSGGGTGFSFSRLRPANDEVQTTKGVSSGPISFMSIFDQSTQVVKQGGTRRGANIGILHYTHPDILKFISAKKTAGKLENFNISVTVDDKFMQAVKANQDYDIINPHGNKVVGRLNAREVFHQMVQAAWETGDPGIIFIDRINDSDSNPTSQLGQIESTNPCGEQPLLPYEPCNLGSLNLSRFVRDDGNDMDYNRLRDAVHMAVHFLDNVIDVNNYPIPQIEEMAKGNRRIGLGVMGWAETLVLLGLPYNSEDAYKMAEDVMKFVNDTALEASQELAKTRGVFPNFRNSIYDKEGQFFHGVDARPRHSARTTIAPTGTIGITAGLQGAGIEPFFAIAYVRYNAKALDKIKSGEEPDPQDCFWEVNPLFRTIAEENDFFGLEETELWKKIDVNHKSVVGIKEIPDEIQNLFLSSHDLTPLEHVRVQAAFQKHTNNAVSKTVNLKNSATPHDVEEVYIKAYELGVKGVTIYRDGSKQFQVLNLAERKKVSSAPAFGDRSAYYEIETGQGQLHIHINYDENGPKRVFVNMSPLGTEISGLTSAVGILLSKYLEMGGDPVRILKHLNSIKGDKPYGFGPKRVDSIPHGISKALRDHLVKTAKMPDNGNGNGKHPPVQQVLTPQTERSIYCPKCYSPNVIMSSGCSGPTCFDCGYSECS